MRTFGRRMLIVGLVTAVAIAGILTGHWISRVPQGGHCSGSALVVLHVDSRGTPDLRAFPDLATTDSSGVQRTALRVVTEPEGATISVDGIEVPGTTPITHGTQAGKHTVIASYPGFEDRTQTVTVPAGRVQTMHLKLTRIPDQPTPTPKKTHKTKKTPKKPRQKVAPDPQGQPPTDGHGYLFVTTTPWSTVYLGGRKLGETPLAKVRLPAGSHTLRFVDESGRSTTRQVTIKPDAPTKLSFTLPR